MTPSPKSPSLSRSVSIMAAGTVLSRITGFIRNAALIAVLGVTAMGDTYTVANNVPNIVYELVVGGILSATLVPVFSRLFATEKTEEAWRAVSAVFTLTVIAISLLTVGLLFAAPLVVELYTFMNEEDYAEAQKETATFLLRLFAPQIAMYGIVSIATGVLNSRRYFGPPMFAPVLNNLVVIAMLVALPRFSTDRSLEAMQSDTTGLLILGLGTTAGVVAMALVLVPFLRRASGGQLGFHWDVRNPAVHTMLKMSGWAVGFVVANQIALWVVFVLANRSEGGVITFMTAYMFFILPHAIFSVSLMSALQPELAEQWAKKAFSNFVARMAVGIRMLALVIGPATAFFCFLALPITEVFIANGLVTEAAAREIGEVLILMAIGLPGFSLFLYCTRTLQAMHEARKVFYLYVFQNGINVATAFAFYPLWQVQGLALSQSVAYSVASIVALLVIRRLAGGIGGKALAISLARLGVVVGLLSVVLALCMTVADELESLAQLTLSTVLGLLAFGLAAKFIAPSELGLIFRSRRRAVPSQSPDPEEPHP